MGIKDIFKKASAYIHETRELNKAYNEKLREDDREENKANYVVAESERSTSEVAKEPPEEDDYANIPETDKPFDQDPQDEDDSVDLPDADKHSGQGISEEDVSVSASEEISEPISEEEEVLNGLPDFEEIRAPWMVRTYKLEEDLNDVQKKLDEERKKAQNLQKQLDEERKETLDLRKQLEQEQKETHNLRERLNKSHKLEYYERLRLGDLETQISKATVSLNTLHSEVDRKEIELKGLESKIKTLENDYKIFIRKRANYEELSFRIPRGEGSLLKAHAEIHKESLNDFIYKAVKEAIDRDNEVFK